MHHENVRGFQCSITFKMDILFRKVSISSQHLKKKAVRDCEYLSKIISYSNKTKFAHNHYTECRFLD